MLSAKAITVGAVAATLLTAGCDSTPPPTAGQILGSIGGAGLGSAIGEITSDTIAATATGAAMGALIGLAIGTFTDPPGEVKATTATIQAAETGETGKSLAWSTEKSSGTVTPTGAAYDDHGRSCRPLHRETTFEGDKSSRDVIACKTADNIWEVTDPPE